MRFMSLVICLITALCTYQVAAQVSGQELANIDFGAMLGGPLSAVVRAQAAAAQNTVNFINKVGFRDNRTIIYQEFKYTTINETSGQTLANIITVPQLAIVPIPFIRVAECTVEFNAKLSSVTASESSNMRSSSTTRTESLGFWFVSMSSTSSYSNKVTEKNSNREERMFSITVRVNAKQDDMPAGMKKILSLLEDSMLVF